jgi:predicted nucleic acid-binding protein
VSLKLASSNFQIASIDTDPSSSMPIQLKGNAVPDAWLAAATIHLGEHLVSFDRDFRKLIGRSQFTLLETVVG